MYLKKIFFFIFFFNIIFKLYSIQITIPINKLKSLNYHTIDFNINENTYNLYFYRSKYRKNYKKKLYINNLVQDHHIIPKQWKNHKLINLINFDINSSTNIITMPNNLGKYTLNLNNNQLIHDGGHINYNIYVKKTLDYILYNYNNEDLLYNFYLFHQYLKSNMINNFDNIPWN